MCGICGFISRRTISAEQLRAMNDTMIHRGPNDSGVEVEPYGDGFTIGLAQRRLSILDLSELGHQPMTSAGGDVTVVFNGEIYNYRELQKELTDYPFRSSCDTEVILAAYLRWGADFVKRLNGMFAIALYDRQTKDFYLFRDRIGKKPLYYWLDENNIVFGSELKPIMACPDFPRRINRRVIPRYLYQQCVNAPETVFEGVYKLEPGGALHYSCGKIRTWKYWDVYDRYQTLSAEPIPNFYEAKNGLKAELQAAVRRRMISDVPLGCFLSGGYDSSLVTALMAEASETPVKTFSIAFADPVYDESDYAAAVARHLGTDHTMLTIDEPMMLELVDSIPHYYDEPFADSSQIPMMLVAGLARKQVTVALSGDGGDEFFCGYNVYEQARQAQRLDEIGNVVYHIGHMPFRNGRLLDRLPYGVQVVAENRDPRYKTQLGGQTYEATVLAFVGEQTTVKWRVKGESLTSILRSDNNTFLPVRYDETTYAVHDWQNRRMLLDMDTYLPGDILCKVDRATMKYSLEARCPILDTDVMEYSFRIPQKFKYHKGSKKYILKEITYDYIPKELLDRPKKGFGVPIDKWLRGPLRDQLEAVSSLAYLKKQGIFDSAYVSAYVNNYLDNGDGGPGTGHNYSRIIWPFFVWQKWWEKWMG